MYKASVVAILLTSMTATSVAASPDAPSINFCPGDISTASEITTDAAAGITYSSSVHVPRASIPAGGTSGSVGIYFNNDGPGNITCGHPSFSTKSGPVPVNTWHTVSLTPAPGEVSVWDGFWGGVNPKDRDFLGCIFFNAEGRAAPKGTLHLDLYFTRDGVPHTVRVNVRFRD